MSLKSKTFVSIFILFLLFIAGNTNLNAQSWAQCPSGEDIIRCETINCPKGDTNKDGSCSLDDENAQYSDARNNSLCANPTSGCGVIYYYLHLFPHLLQLLPLLLAVFQAPQKNQLLPQHPRSQLAFPKQAQNSTSSIY